jgi:signal transduction histidine kinase
VEQGKILIVDDEPLMCNSLQVLLKNSGFDARTSASGQEALHCFSKEGFDVVLLDMHMPEMGGLELMEHIRNRFPETLCVVITGRASEDSIVESLRKGAFDYLRKPFEHEELLKSVNNAFRQIQLTKKRRMAEDALRKAHEELEKRVDERTAELGEANARLMREIEERKRAEYELQEMNEEVRSFVHAVSHDLKNPLISVQGFSSLLLKNYGEILDEKAIEYVQHIVTNARRMAFLVSDLLTLSMIGQVIPHFEDVDCKQIVGDVVRNLANRLEQKGIRMVISENLPVVCSDKDRLYQVFENLVTNAIKFTGDCPKPTIEVDCRDQNHCHQFVVKDNGIGIEPKFHQKIFENFLRLQEIHDEEGTGLGLPIVTKNLEKLGGDVWVESKKGEGSAFYFSIPKEKGAKKTALKIAG